MLKTVKVKFQNGLDFSTAKVEILSELTSIFNFQESKNPDFIIFGPYGNDIPKKGNYTRIGYFCENIKPDFSCCEWAFGIPEEKAINRENYKRIQWHGLNPCKLIKPDDLNPEQILGQKTKFCNFLYSNPIPYREAFFKQLSKYKRVDAPGRSMNNHPQIDTILSNKWTTKRKFLNEYKFTIAFESDIFPGYQTEKLYDAMLAQSLPIYCGDPNIGNIFNTKSFIDIKYYLPSKHNATIDWLETNCQQDFEDIRPQFYHSPAHRIKRHIKMRGRNLKLNLRLNHTDFKDAIDMIIALDKNPELYLNYLKQPWFNNNSIYEQASTKQQWIKIFNSI